jgi:septal ring factor EnvC (AmiA/AmiB activator)
MIENIRAERGFTSASPNGKPQKFNQEDLDRLEQAKSTIEQKIKEQEKQHKKDVKQWEKSIKEKEEVYEQLQKELKEREQENRISKLKIKEMKRLIKHN